MIYQNPQAIDTMWWIMCEVVQFLDASVTVMEFDNKKIWELMDSDG